MDPVTAPSPRRPIGTRDAGFEFGSVIAGQCRHASDHSNGPSRRRHSRARVAALTAKRERARTWSRAAFTARARAPTNRSSPSIVRRCRHRCSRSSCSAPTRPHRDASRRAGALELAGRGTVYLDDVAELPLALQDRLTRSLEEYGVPRLGTGSPNDTPVHCRVIAASKTRLEEAVSAGTFRDDPARTSRRASHRAAPAPRARRRRAVDRGSLPVDESTRSRRVSPPDRTRRARRAALASLARQRARIEARDRKRGDRLAERPRSSAPST